MRTRALISLAIGLASGCFTGFFLNHFHQGAGDFNWTLWAAQDLLAHRNPYDRTMQLYPLTSVIFGLPLLWLRPPVAAGVFYGASSALMAFGLSRDGYHRLLAFLAYPYWAGLVAAQWSPLILASALIPVLLPASLAKPQLGVPVILTSSTKRGLLATLAIVACTFVLMPRWPWLWVQNFNQYARFIPLLVLPGPLLAMALFRFRERDARLLFLMAAVPQRWFYDPLILWLIPKSRREIMATVGLSWVVGIWRWYHVPHTFTQAGRWMVIFMYLPMLGVIWLRPRVAERFANPARDTLPALGQHG